MEDTVDTSTVLTGDTVDTITVHTEDTVEAMDIAIKLNPFVQ